MIFVLFFLYPFLFWAGTRLDLLSGAFSSLSLPFGVSHRNEGGGERRSAKEEGERDRKEDERESGGECS